MGDKIKKNFKKNFNDVNAINEKSLSYKAGINEFAILSDEEFEARNLG